MLQWLTRAALEVIGRCGLGYSFDSLTGDEPSSPYATTIKNLLPYIFSFAVFLPYLEWIVKLGPPAFRRRLISIIPSKKLLELRDMVDLMDRTSATIFSTKKAALSKGDSNMKEGVESGKDLMSILLRANMAIHESERLPDSELLAQMSSLIFAAMDTTSGTMNRIIHLLAQHPRVQERLRAEIIAAKYSKKEKLTHDELVSLSYLDSVVKETLRLYPPGCFLTRKTRTDALLPLSTPVTSRNGELITAIPVPKDTFVYIATMASNRSKAIWGSDTLEWKPERWLDGIQVKSATKIPGVYSNMMTFNGGGRSCIGFKFALLEMKVIISTLMESFRFSLPEKREIVWKMSGAGIAAPAVDGDIQLPLKVELV